MANGLTMSLDWSVNEDETASAVQGKLFKPTGTCPGCKESTYAFLLKDAFDDDECGVMDMIVCSHCGYSVHYQSPEEKRQREKFDEERKQWNKEADP